MDKSLFVQP